MRPVNAIDFLDIYEDQYSQVKKMCENASILYTEAINLLLYIRQELNEKTRSMIKGKNTDLTTLLFITKVIEIIDTMAVLIHSSSIGGIKDELRILFETCVSSKFILNSDKSEDFADAYWIEYWVNKKKMCELFLSEKYKDSHSFYKDILENQSSIDDLKKQIDYTNDFLKKHYPNLYSNWKPNRNWYQNKGINTFRELCKLVDFESVNGEALYEDIYSLYSLGIHGKASYDLMNVGSDGFNFVKIRNPKGIGTLINLTFFIVNDYCCDIIKNYLNNNKCVLTRFEKYIENHITERKFVIQQFGYIK